MKKFISCSNLEFFVGRKYFKLLKVMEKAKRMKDEKVIL